MPLYSRFGKGGKKEEQDESSDGSAPVAEPEDVPSEEHAVESGDESEEEAGDQKLVLPTVPQDWAERLQVTSQKPLVKGDNWNADDDSLREKLFEEQALRSVETALLLLKQHGIPNKRPADYYAEMIKSDIQMNKVKENMDYAKDKLKSQAERRQQKHAQKFGKAVQNQVLQEREAEKAKSIQKIEHLKKKAKAHGMGAANDDDVEVAFGGDGDDGSKKTATKRKRSLTPGKQTKKPRTGKK